MIFFFNNLNQITNFNRNLTLLYLVSTLKNTYQTLIYSLIKCYINRLNNIFTKFLKFLKLTYKFNHHINYHNTKPLNNGESQA